MRSYLIKLLGGYTKKEYTRIENKYQALIDSKSTSATNQIVNEYVERALWDLYEYAKSLYGSSLWADKMYHVLRNNWQRVRMRYINCNSVSCYRVDTTLDREDQFLDIMREENNFFILEND